MKKTAVFSQTEFIHGQFPFKSLEITIDSDLATLLARKCEGEIFVILRFFGEISSQAFYSSTIFASDSRCVNTTDFMGCLSMALPI